MYNIYSFILNYRLTQYLEENLIYVNEQNGFRKTRSCEEHVYLYYVYNVTSLILVRFYMLV